MTVPLTIDRLIDDPEVETFGLYETNFKFFSKIKIKKQDTQGVAPLKSNGKLENDSKKKAPILNDQFKAVFSEPSPSSLEQLCKQTMDDASHKVPQMDPFKIMEEGVSKLLSSINPPKAAGSNKLQPHVLKELADALAPMVTLIYNAKNKCLESERLQT